MGRVDVKEEFQQFPVKPVFCHRVWDFNKFADIGDWTWSVSGHTAPAALNDAAFGTLTLGSGSALDNAYVSGQAKGETVRLNGLGKTYEFEFIGTLSDATQSDLLLGICITNTNLINTVSSDGIFFRKDDGDTNIDICMAFNAATAPDDYTQTLAVATMDTNPHTYAIRVVTDASTLGKGVVSFYIDGALVGSFNVITAALPHDEELRLSVAVQNGEAVAKTFILDLAGEKLER